MINSDTSKGINWNKLLKILEVDDGSLPEIELNNLLADEVIDAYEFLRVHSEKISSIDPSYWSILENRPVLFSYKNNPSIFVVKNEADPFHICFDGIRSPNGKKVLQLGVYVFKDSLTLDYKMGSQWNYGLFELLEGITKNCNKVEVLHKNNINDNDGSIFQILWQRYQENLKQLKRKK